MSLDFTDYYQAIDVLDPNLSREENLERLNEKLVDIQRISSGPSDKRTEHIIKDAKKYFENDERYQEYRASLFEYYKDKVTERVYIAAIDSKVPPKKKHAIIQQCQAVFGLNYSQLSELVDEVVEEEGFEIAEPERAMQASYENIKTSIQTTAQEMKDATMRQIKSTALLRDFTGSQRALNIMAGSAGLLLVVHLTVGAIAGFWILIVLVAFYLWIKRER